MDPSQNSIERLAYALWEARGGPNGSPEVDWLAAEREIKGTHPKPPPGPKLNGDELLGTTPDTDRKAT